MSYAGLANSIGLHQNLENMGDGRPGIRSSMKDFLIGVPRGKCLVTLG